ncbi:hypothetical protein COMA2_40079 [Candidatus Nitrospira nitrificans]|uniref:Uncharacterized protein n=2 Tax=Candidatus Nitrospira nitrificans TaxID=1742973 RepID=A0A0S4LS18_9BACT|nr:hypothetical protein COMA2_40079 [Candidatus Nitrospira nitrificans]
MGTVRERTNRFLLQRFDRLSYGITVGVLISGVAGCSGMSDSSGGFIPKTISPISDIVGLPLPTTGNPFPFPLPTACLSLGSMMSWDLAKEGLAFKTEEATVESALDRVNTAARIIEIGGLIMKTLPIAAGSAWPKQGDSSVPLTEEGKLRNMLQQDPAHYGRNTQLTSALKLKAMYLQTIFFARYPDLFALRKIGVANPTEDEVQALQRRVLGENSSPIFTKVFYRFLKYNPAFEPKPELFMGKLDGKASEVYTSLPDAVESLAENKHEIKLLREAVLQAEEKKAKEYRDILDLEQRIKQLEAAEFGNPSTADEAAQASNRDTNAGQVEELKQQLAVQKNEFETTVAAYKQEIEKLGLELAKIKTQPIVFNPEQQALAKNIQTAVNAVKGTMCQSQLLLAIAGYHFKEAGPNWQREVQSILRQAGPGAPERIKQITLNIAILPANLSVLTTESGVLEKEVKAYDGLFASRIAVEAGGDGTSNDGSGMMRSLGGLLK